MHESHREENEKEKRVSNYVTAGLGALVLATISSPLWLQYACPDKLPRANIPASTQSTAPAEQQPQVGKPGKPGMMYLQLKLGEGRNLELALSPNTGMADVELVSATLTLDEKARADWARYAPVRLIIPGLNHVQPFPVENGERTLYSPLHHTVHSRQTLHYMIAGWDPATGKARELENRALHFGGKPK